MSLLGLPLGMLRPILFRQSIKKLNINVINLEIVKYPYVMIPPNR